MNNTKNNKKTNKELKEIINKLKKERKQARVLMLKNGKIIVLKDYRDTKKDRINK